MLVLGPLLGDELMAFHEFGKENPTLVPTKDIQTLTMITEERNNEPEDDYETDPFIDGLGTGAYDAYLDQDGNAQLRPVLDESSSPELDQTCPLLSVLMLRCTRSNPPPVQYSLSFKNLPSQGFCDTHGSNLIPDEHFLQALKDSAAQKLASIKADNTCLPEDEEEKRYIFEQLWWYIHNQIGACAAYKDKTFFFSFKATVSEMMKINDMVGECILEVYTIEGDIQCLYHKGSKHRWDCIGLYQFMKENGETKPRFRNNYVPTFDTKPCYLSYEQRMVR